MDEKVFVKPIEAKGIETKVITPQDEYSYFFGYYDIQPFDSNLILSFHPLDLYNMELP